MSRDNRIQAYLDHVCSQVCSQQVHADIRLELTAHIEEIITELSQSGLAPEEALNQALERMGDPDVVGRQLHQAHQPRTEWSLFALLGCLVGLGLLASYSVQRVAASPADAQFASLFIRQLLFSALGLGMALALFYTDYRRLQRYAPHVYGLLTLLIIVSIIGAPRVNGKVSLGWGPLSFPAMDVTLTVLITAMAGIFSRWNWSNPHAILGAIGLLAWPVILYLAIPSLPAVMMTFVAFLALMLASGAKWWQTLLTGLLTTACGLSLLIGEPYRITRLFSFLNAHRDPQGAGWLYLRTQEIVQSAGLWGRGFDLTSRDLPAMHTDLVFPTLVHTYGWAMGAVIVGIVLIFIMRTSRVALATHDRFGRILAAGLCSVFAVQFAWNILMALGWAPMTAVSLPFISYGGSQMVFHMMAIGLVLSIYRHKDMIGLHA